MTGAGVSGRGALNTTRFASRAVGSQAAIGKSVLQDCFPVTALLGGEQTLARQGASVLGTWGAEWVGTPGRLSEAQTPHQRSHFRTSGAERPRPPRPARHSRSHAPAPPAAQLLLRPED